MHRQIKLSGKGKSADLMDGSIASLSPQENKSALSNIPVEDWVRTRYDEFLVAKEVRSENTQRIYRADVGHFVWWLEQVHSPSIYSLYDLDQFVIRDFIAYLRTAENKRWGSDHPSCLKPLNEGGQAHIARSVRVFCKWLTKEASLPFPIWHNIDMPVVPEREVDFFTVSECKELFQVINDVCESDLVRSRTITFVTVALDTGLRLSELLSLTIDMPFATGQIKVIGKGNRERYVEVGPDAQAAIADWLIIRKKYTTKDQRTLFINEFGEAAKQSTIHSIMRRLDEQMLINVHSHKLRHSYGTWAYHLKVDTVRIKRQLGHKSIDTTERMYIGTRGPLEHRTTDSRVSPLSHMRQIGNMPARISDNRPSAPVGRKARVDLPSDQIIAADASSLGVRGAARKYDVDEKTIRVRVKRHEGQLKQIQDERPKLRARSSRFHLDEDS